jgi:hypothetical protein
MSLHFLLFGRHTFEKRIVPALGDSRRLRSFEPCRTLSESLLPALESQANRHALGESESMLHGVIRGLAYDRDFWRALVGEILWFGAEGVPEIDTMPEMLGELLGVTADGVRPREEYSPIEQVHFGSQDLVLGGGYYRPNHVGYNSTADVERLGRFLASLDPSGWTVTPYIDADDLAYVQEWLPALQTLYREMHERDQVMVCEIL